MPFTVVLVCMWTTRILPSQTMRVLRCDLRWMCRWMLQILPGGYARNRVRDLPTDCCQLHPLVGGCSLLHIKINIRKHASDLSAADWSYESGRNLSCTSLRVASSRHARLFRQNWSLACSHDGLFSLLLFMENFYRPSTRSLQCQTVNSLLICHGRQITLSFESQWHRLPKSA